MRSLRAFPRIHVVKVYDENAARLAAFSKYWKVPAAASMAEILDDGAGSAPLILNLTNPASHFEVNRICLNAGKHVYSEKPLALDFSEAQTLCTVAARKGLMIGSAPCNVLGEAAQTLWSAV